MIPKKTIIAGSRNITDYNILLDAIKCISWKIESVVSGTAKGVDTLGERYAKENNIRVYRFLAQWNEFGKLAGRIRNTEMAKHSEALLAIWDGKSPGTKHMIEIATRCQLDIFVYRTDIDNKLLSW